MKSQVSFQYMFKLNSIVADKTTTCAVTANAPLQRSLSLQHLRLHFVILSELPSVYVPSLHFFSISSHIVFSMHARHLNFLPLSRSASGFNADRCSVCTIHFTFVFVTIFYALVTWANIALQGIRCWDNETQKITALLYSLSLSLFIIIIILLLWLLFHSFIHSKYFSVYNWLKSHA